MLAVDWLHPFTLLHKTEIFIKNLLHILHYNLMFLLKEHIMFTVVPYLIKCLFEICPQVSVLLIWKELKHLEANL